MEIWKEVKGYEGLYEVSDEGRVRSIGRWKTNHSKMQWVEEKIKVPRLNNYGYYITDLYKDNKSRTISIHRLVALNFIENPEDKYSVNHIDGVKTNNCVENLEWATAKEQNHHFYNNGLKSEENIRKAVKAMNKANSKAVYCKELDIKFDSQADARRYFGYSASYINRAVRNSKVVKVKETGDKVTLVYV